MLCACSSSQTSTSEDASAPSEAGPASDAAADHASTNGNPNCKAGDNGPEPGAACLIGHLSGKYAGADHQCHTAYSCEALDSCFVICCSDDGPGVSGPGVICSGAAVDAGGDDGGAHDARAD